MIWIIIAILIAIFLIFVFTLSWRISNHVIKPSFRDNEKLLEREKLRGKYDEEFLRQITEVPLDFTMEDGIHLSAELLDNENTLKENNGKQKKIVILSHGFRCSRVCSYIYAKVFLNLGYTVLAYDQRNHGDSDKTFSGMGYYEAKDLNEIIHWCYEKFGQDAIVVTHGDSMGGSTVLLQLAYDERVTAVISDCPFSNLEDLLIHQVRHRYYLPAILVKTADYITFKRAGFHFNDVSPIACVQKTQTPILFIHGKEDNYVPTDMSRQLYHVSKGYRELYIVDYAKHSASCVTNMEEYQRRMKEFIDRVYK